MAATCQERGITHVKDVFSGPSKSSNCSNEEPSDSFFFGFSTGTKPSEGPSGSGVGKAAGSRPGGFLMRNGKNKAIDIMEIPVPPPRKERTSSKGHSESEPVKSPTSPSKPTNTKDTYLAPRSVQKPAQRNPSGARGEEGNRRKDVTVAVIHPPPAATIPSPRVVPMSPKRQAPLPPGPASPNSIHLGSPHRASMTKSDPPLPPPPPPQFALSPPPRSSHTPAVAAPPPPDVPLLPPPPPPMSNTGSPSSFKTSRNDAPLRLTRTDITVPNEERSSKSRYSSDSHTLHIDTASPLKHGHRGQGSGDYSTGSLFGGEDDRDILNSANQDTNSPVFRESNIPAVSVDTKSPSARTGLKVVDSKPSPNSALFKKKPQPDVIDYKKSLLDNESSILTNSEHGAASSGYFSELSTDSEKSPPSPVLKNHKGTSNGSSSSSFEEEEFSVNFDDDKFAETKSRKVYHEYDGEDFGKYLQEDDMYPPSTTTLTRRVQRKKQQQYGQPRTLPPPNRPPTPQGQKKAGLKEKFTQAFTLTRSEKKMPRYHGNPHNHYQQQTPKTSIHQMSFMSSKMGMYASEEELRDYMSRDLETKSDLGGIKRSPSQEMPSWHKDTLSMSTLRRAKRELEQQRGFSSSTPNLADPGYYTGGSISSPPGSPRYGESYSDFGADIKKKKKVNRFKFWKVFGKKKKESSPVIENQPQCVDVRL